MKRARTGWPVLHVMGEDAPFVAALHSGVAPLTAATLRPPSMSPGASIP